MKAHLRRALTGGAALALLVAGGVNAQADRPSSFLDSLAASPSISASTTPASGPAAGDQNPYGVAVVPRGFRAGGALHPGDILVSNFNNAANLQGTGTSIVAVTPSGQASTFFAAPKTLAPVGLTTALVALRSGLVVVGNTPTTDGTVGTITNGSLIFTDQNGNVVLNLSDSALLQGPWDLVADDSRPNAPILYVSNVLSGTVTRVNLRVTSAGGAPVVRAQSLTQIASGFLHRTDPAALVVGPTGLVLGDDDTLYVADTGNNRVQVLHDVRETGEDLGAGRTVVAGAPLQGPLGLALTPFGTLVASNGDAVSAGVQPNMVVEINPETRRFVATRQLDTGAPGGIFGIAIAPVSGRSSLLFANDNDVTVKVLPPA